MEWILAIAVVVLAAMAVVVAVRLRRRRLRKKVRLEIANVGNVKNRYNLRAEDPQGVLQFHFSLDGDGLPTQATARPAPAQTAAARPAAARGTTTAGGAREKANALIQMSNALAGLLSMVGSLLPRSVGIPLQQKASQMRRVQAKASYAQQVPTQMSWLKSSAARAVPGAPAPKAAKAGPAQERTTVREETLAGSPDDGAADHGLVWSQTPYIEPGASLDIDLTIRAVRATGTQVHTYQVISRAADGTAAPVLTAESSVEFRGGFWARRFLPYLLIVAIAAAILMLIYWLSSAGLLA